MHAFSRWMIAMCVFACGNAAAEMPDIEMGRYLAKYPAMYSTLSFSSNERDEAFDAQGQRQSSAAPTYGTGNAFEEQRGSMQFEWHFPWFETEALPFISSRLWTARATLGYAKLDTRGPINDFISANSLESKGDGLTDIQLEFGPLLWGSQDWRTRKDTPQDQNFSLMLLGQVIVPSGQRNPDAPNNVGITNAFGFGTKLGAHWRPLPSVLVDAGVNWRSYTKNEEPAFGAQEPAARGDELLVDLTLNARVVRGLYAGLSYYRRDASANTYEKVRFASNPPSAPLGMETMPDPRAMEDRGTLEQTLGASLRWFFSPRVSLTLHYLRPQSGRSGAFDLPYTRQTIACAATLSCSPQANGSARVDGLGSARTYSSETWIAALSWNYGQGDFWMSGN